MNFGENLSEMDVAMGECVDFLGFWTKMKLWHIFGSSKLAHRQLACRFAIRSREKWSGRCMWVRRLPRLGSKNC